MEVKEPDWENDVKKMVASGLYGKHPYIYEGRLISDLVVGGRCNPVLAEKVVVGYLQGLKKGDE